MVSNKHTCPSGGVSGSSVEQLPGEGVLPQHSLQLHTTQGQRRDVVGLAEENPDR